MCLRCAPCCLPSSPAAGRRFPRERPRRRQPALRQPDRIIRLGPGSHIYSFCLTPDGGTAYAHAARVHPGEQSARDELIAINLKTGADHVLASPSELGDEDSEHMALSPDSATLLVFRELTDDARPIRLVTVRTGKVTSTVPAKPLDATLGWQPAFSSDGRFLYFSEGQQPACLVTWDIAASREVRRVTLRERRPEVGVSRYALWFRDNRVIAVESTSVVADGAFQVDPASGSRKAGFTIPPGPFSCPPAASTNCVTQRRFWSIAAGPTRAPQSIGAWDLASGRKLETISLPRGAWWRQVLISGDDRLLLVRGDGVFAIYQVAAGRWTDRLAVPVWMTLPGEAAFNSLSADGRTLVTAGTLPHDPASARSTQEDAFCVFDLSRDVQADHDARLQHR